MARNISERMGEIRYELANNTKFAIMSIAALLLTGAAFFTTVRGMIRHSNEIFTSILITAGIQLFILALAWHVGEVLVSDVRAGETIVSGRRRRKPFLASSGPFIALAVISGAVFALATGQIGGLAMLGIIIGVILAVVLISARRQFAPVFFYILAMSISVFFSFDSRYAAYSPPEKRTNEAVTLARDAVDRGSKTLTRQISRELTRDRQGLTDGVEWAAFKKKVDTILELAERQGAAVVDAVKRARSAADGRVAQVAGTRKEKQLRKDELTRLKKVLGLEIDGLKGRKAVLEPQVAVAREAKAAADLAVATKQEEIKNEKKQGRQGRQPGCGNECGKLMRELVPLLQDQAEASSRLKIAEDQLRPVSTALSTREGEVDSADAEINSLLEELGAADSELKTTQQEIASSANSPEAADAAGLKKSRSDYESEPTRVGFKQLLLQCQGLLGVMRGITGMQVPDNLDCDPGAYAASASSYYDLQDRKAAFEVACSSANVDAASRPPGTSAGAAMGSEQLDESSAAKAASADTGSEAAGVPRTQAEQRQVFHQLMDLGRRCVRLAPITESSVSGEVLTSFSDLELIVDPEANNKIAANLAALDRRDSTAMLALVIAMAIDGLILLAAIYGARATVGPIALSGALTAEERQKAYTRALDILPIVPDWAPQRVKTARIVLNHIRLRAADDKFDAGSTKSDDGEFQGILGLSRATAENALVVEQALLGFPEHVRRVSEGRLLIHERLIMHLQQQIADWQGRVRAAEVAQPSSGRARAYGPKLPGDRAGGTRPPRPMDAVARGETAVASDLDDAYARHVVHLAARPPSRVEPAHGSNGQASPAAPQPDEPRESARRTIQQHREMHGFKQVRSNGRSR